MRLKSAGCLCMHEEMGMSAQQSRPTFVREGSPFKPCRCVRLDRFFRRPKKLHWPEKTLHMILDQHLFRALTFLYSIATPR